MSTRTLTKRYVAQTLDPRDVSRIIHAIGVARAQFEADISTFKQAAAEQREAGNPSGAEVMDSMAAEFRHYVEDTDRISAILGCAEYGAADVALVTFDEVEAVETVNYIKASLEGLD